MSPFKIFIGYDPKKDVAYEVCDYSLLKRSTIPIEIIPIKQSELRETNHYWLDRNKLESTEFSFTRFLTPFLADYKGGAMFVDCDFLCLSENGRFTRERNYENGRGGSDGLPEKELVINGVV